VAAPTLSGLRIEGNTITDSHAVTRNVYGMLLQAAASKYCSLLDNEVRLMGGDQSAFLAHIHLADDVVRPYLRGVFAGFKYDDAGAGRQFAPGSQVTDPRNGRVYRLAADNRTWRHE